jgi:hypothetical protein
VVFATVSTYGHHPHPKVIRRSYDGEIDQAMLRVEPTKNAESRRVRWASRYEIARVELY